MIITGFFIFKFMSCRIKSIKPPCGYSLDGIALIWLLDFDDFSGYRFEGGSYKSCLVTDILRTGEFVELSAPDMVAKYNSTEGGVHTLQSFVGTLEAETIANLHLGTKRRQIVLFKANTGKYFTFGYEAGAVLTYANQTAEGIGSVVNLNAPSIYPLFEVTADAVNRFVSPYRFAPDFDNNAYCEQI